MICWRAQSRISRRTASRLFKAAIASTGEKRPMLPSAYHVAAKISSGSPVYVAWLGIAEPVLADIFAREGYDAVVFDGQHGMFDDNAMARGFAVVSSIGVPVIGRIPVGNFAMAARFL